MIPARLERHIAPDPATGCWLWRGALIRGYGRVRWPHGGKSARQVMAHRAVFMASGRSIPDGLTLDHLCRNPACVNPDHLEPVTSWENTLRSPIHFAAVNARKTECPRGHLLLGSNLYVKPDGRRVCKACRYASKAARRQRLGRSVAG